MPNGDCPVGAGHTAEIVALDRRVTSLENTQAEQGKEQQTIRLEQAKLAWSVGLILVVGSTLLNKLIEYLPKLVGGG